MSGDKSYKMYRQHIKIVSPPCIPFLGVYLKDLTFIEDGNLNLVNGLINFSKRKQLSDVIQSLLQFQGHVYNLQKVPQIVTFLQPASKWNEKKHSLSYHY